jgi:thiol-disulfide isomerase/thioredoxin
VISTKFASNCSRLRMVFSLVASLGFAVAASAAAQGDAAKIGAQVVEFERNDSTGKPVKLSDLLKSSTAVVVDFWSTRCPVSKKYEPTIKKLAADYTPKGVTFVAIDSNYNEPADEVQQTRGERSVPYPVLMDLKEGSLATYFGASHTPEAYVITSAGVLAYHGNLDEIAPALDAVLSGKLVQKAETRAFGCSIKRP